MTGFLLLFLGLWLLGASALVGLGWGVHVADWWARHAWHAGLTLAFLAALWAVERPVSNRTQSK